MNSITHEYTNAATAAYCADTESIRLTEALGFNVVVTYEEVAPGRYMLVIPSLTRVQEATVERHDKRVQEECERESWWQQLSDMAWEAGDFDGSGCMGVLA